MQPNDLAARAHKLTRLFGRIYLHLHPRRGPGEYRPSGESLAILRHLAVSGPLSISEAAAHFDRSQAATSELVERLIRRGLVARQPAPRDRRRHETGFASKRVCSAQGSASSARRPAAA